MWVAMLIKGIGSGCNNAGYPDLSLGIDPNDAASQVRPDQRARVVSGACCAHTRQMVQKASHPW